MFGEDRISMIQLEEPERRECPYSEWKEGATEPVEVVFSDQWRPLIEGFALCWMLYPRPPGVATEVPKHRNQPNIITDFTNRS
jgi:hypothetical protein